MISRTTAFKRWLPALLCLAGLAGYGTVQAAHVEVAYNAANSDVADSDIRVHQLKAWLARDASQLLPPDRTLTITLTRVDFAGRIEWWRGAEYGSTPIVRDIYPPRVVLRFELRDAAGAVTSGTRDLHTLEMRTPFDAQDPLRYEKKLLDDWLHREFTAQQ